MAYITEGEVAKPITIIEYSGNRQAPALYTLQAQEILFEKYDGLFIPSVFTRNLARLYITSLREASEDAPVLDIDRAFPRFKNIARVMTMQLSWILFATDGNLAKKKILDLGCGSTGDTEESVIEQDSSLFHPWLCRALGELGASPIGVDIGNLEGEKFETYRTNLLIPNALALVGIPDDSIDVVHSRALFTSPELEVQFSNVPVFWQRQSEKTNYLLALLQPQIERVLKPNGVFVYCRDLF